MLARLAARAARYLRGSLLLLTVSGFSRRLQVVALRNDVEAFASTFPTIGFDEDSMRYPL